ncbi:MULTISPECIES: hypothetical protein [Streptomyces]
MLPDAVKVLTGHEREVTALAAHGKSKIANQLVLSALTVLSHM